MKQNVNFKAKQIVSKTWRDDDKFVQHVKKSYSGWHVVRKFLTWFLTWEIMDVWSFKCCCSNESNVKNSNWKFRSLEKFHQVGKCRCVDKIDKMGAQRKQTWIIVINNLEHKLFQFVGKWIDLYWKMKLVSLKSKWWYRFLKKEWPWCSLIYKLVAVPSI